jgi:hypothetical protein
VIKILNAMIVKDHEGKASGSILHGLLYAHECTLLVNFCIHDAKINPGGHTGSPDPLEVPDLLTKIPLRKKI